jgi:hypothetical protein
MIKKFLRWEINMKMRFYNADVTGAGFQRWEINSKIRFYNWLYPEDPIPLIEKNKK